MLSQSVRPGRWFEAENDSQSQLLLQPQAVCRRQSFSAVSKTAEPVIAAQQQTAAFACSLYGQSCIQVHQYRHLHELHA